MVRDFSIHNTLDRTKQKFSSLEQGKIKLYVCGMTVYDYCHLGHARVLLTFDGLVRLWRYLGWQVDYVRNITDVDDKIIKRAKERGVSAEQLAQEFMQASAEDEQRLGLIAPDTMPRVTEHLEEIIQFITQLIEKGNAYVSQGDVYFNTESFADYGKLSGRSIQDITTESRLKTNPLKKSVLDFALWKADAEQGWDSPWGKGRPGWHIECSAMSHACLGERLDIHGGGPDLIFPHHENEIAQSEACHNKPYANYWLHVAPLRVQGEKMSKSLGNFFTLRDCLDAMHPDVIRYFIFQSHYHSHIDYSEQTLEQAKKSLINLTRVLQTGSPRELSHQEFAADEIGGQILQALTDDFSTSTAIALMHQLRNEITHNPENNHCLNVLFTAGRLLGLFHQGLELAVGEMEITIDEIEQQIQQREQAKMAQDYAKADNIRLQLEQAGILLEDTKEGTSWHRK